MKHKSRHFTARWLVLPMLVFVFSQSVFAVTLAEYKKKIHDAKVSLDVILFSDADELNQKDNSVYERNAVAQLRARFPANEKVDWKGESVEVENGWISERLAAYENEKDPSRRMGILTEISERLSVIEIKINELENAENSARSKDEDKQKLAEILRRAEFQKPEPKKENFLQQKWREFQERLDKVFPSPKINKSSNGGFQSFSYVLQIIIFAVVFAIIGFLLYRFAPFLFQKFKSREKKDRGQRIILGEKLAADATSQNLFDEAEKLAREGNLRGAIRKGYIALLCELADRKIIGLAQHKTNRDYLRDVRNSKDLYQNMTGLTSSFERHWYGFDSTDEKDWEEFRQIYKRAVKSN